MIKMPKKLNENTKSLKSYGLLTQLQRKLLDSAEKAIGTSYAPFSNFHVGAAVLTKSGKIMTGSNVENASYGLTVCAERSAIFRANASGHRNIVAIAIIAKGEDFDSEEPTRLAELAGR